MYTTYGSHPRLTHEPALGFYAGYVGSMGATLYAALVMHSYIMSLICCAVQARLVTLVRRRMHNSIAVEPLAVVAPVSLAGVRT